MYKTKRLYLKTIKEVSTALILKYYERNREFLKLYEPLRDASYYTFTVQDQMRNFDIELFEQKSSLKLFLFKPSNEDEIIGILNFSQIVMNAFCSCYVGYSLSFDNEGVGYMSEALEMGINIMFKDYDLHRIEGNVMSTNHRSIGLLKKFNFINEGVSRHYLKINGQWEDHCHYVLLNE